MFAASHPRTPPYLRGTVSGAGLTQQLKVFAAQPAAAEGAHAASAAESAAKALWNLVRTATGRDK
jgi:hypothetical protein